MIIWQWVSYEQLGKGELYEALRLRQEVFIVEQKCPYLDSDRVDLKSWHLLGWQDSDTGTRKLVAYCRVVMPGVKYDEYSIGRVVSSLSVRREGFGLKLMTEVLSRIENTFGKVAIRISAQQYLERFYQGFGFQTLTEPYQEDDIPHVEMLRPAPV